MGAPHGPLGIKHRRKKMPKLALVKTDDTPAVLLRIEDHPTAPTIPAHKSGAFKWVPLVKVPGGTDKLSDDGLFWERGVALPSLVDERTNHYLAADVEYVRRSLLAAEGVTVGLGKVRGGTPQARLIALSIKASNAGDVPLSNALAAVHDKLEALKDKIEAAATIRAIKAIDPSEDGHWI